MLHPKQKRVSRCKALGLENSEDGRDKNGDRCKYKMTTRLKRRSGKHREKQRNQYAERK